MTNSIRSLTKSKGIFLFPVLCNLIKNSSTRSGVNSDSTMNECVVRRQGSALKINFKPCKCGDERAITDWLTWARPVVVGSVYFLIRCNSPLLLSTLIHNSGQHSMGRYSVLTGWILKIFISPEILTTNTIDTRQSQRKSLYKLQQDILVSCCEVSFNYLCEQSR